MKAITCPCGCNHSFVPPAVPKKTRKRAVLLTDDECLAAYSVTRDKFLAAYGVPYRPDTMTFTLSTCSGCRKTLAINAGCINGLCLRCYKATVRCILCGEARESDQLDSHNVCTGCTTRFDDINQRAAEVARQNAA